MTENKRFELAYEHDNWWAVRDGDITLWKEEVVDLLNELADENEQLKDALNQRTDQCDKYYKENKQLKSENQQIRDTIKEMYETERTALGKSVLKQLLETIQ